jgi:hypothetical protein
MAKEKKSQQSDPSELTLEEARAFRASLYKPIKKALSEVQKREAFRIFWAGNKAKYGRGKAIEKAIWLHLKAIKMDTPEQFSQGLANFGLKKVK